MYLRYRWHMHKTVSARVVWLMLPDHLPKHHIVHWTFYPALNQNGNRCGVCPTWRMRCCTKPVSLTCAGALSAWLSRRTKLNRRGKIHTVGTNILLEFWFWEIWLQLCMRQFRLQPSCLNIQLSCVPHFLDAMIQENQVQVRSCTLLFVFFPS